jgi:tRNA threonylcarbamoyladenosine biosynthesis protein TsaB
MALILCIETATEVCSVALFRDGQPAGIRESSARNVHSAMLTTFIDELFRDSGLMMNELDAVAVSMGPGSYTGLRIGVATAKGLCYAVDKPLISVSTLQAMARGLNDNLQVTSDGGALVCPMIDARRMEVYSALYDMKEIEVREVRAEIIDENSFAEFLAMQPVLFGGDGADKCKSMLGDHPNARFVDGFRSSARFMAALAEKKFSAGQFENLAYFEPFYLKDFVAGKPRVKGLH